MRCWKCLDHTLRSVLEVHGGAQGERWQPVSIRGMYEQGCRLKAVPRRGYIITSDIPRRADVQTR